MKRQSMIVFAAILFFACKKSDISHENPDETITASSRPDAAGNLQTRVYGVV